MISVQDCASLEALAGQWQLVESDIRKCVASLDEKTLASSLAYVNAQGEEWSYPLWQMIRHLPNHQSYHRGQVAMLLRMLECSLSKSISWCART